MLCLFRNVDTSLFIPLAFLAFLHEAKSTPHTMKRHHLPSPASKASAAAAAAAEEKQQKIRLIPQDDGRWPNRSHSRLVQ